MTNVQSLHSGDTVIGRVAEVTEKGQWVYLADLDAAVNVGPGSWNAGAPAWFPDKWVRSAELPEERDGG